MTRATNARLAGVTFLLYIAAGVAEMVLLNRATGVTGLAAKLANVAGHVTELRLAIVLQLLTALAALVLGVTLYAITRDEDRELAMLGLGCRTIEAVLNALPLTTLGLLWLGTASGPSAPDAAAATAIGALLLKIGGWKTGLGATMFAVGSTLFSVLLLRGRMIPGWLAWLGVAGSALLVLALPAQLVGVLARPASDVVWIPMAAFEIAVAVWFLVRGVAPVTRRA